MGMNEYWQVTVKYKDGSEAVFDHFVDIKHYDNYVRCKAYEDAKVIFIPYDNVKFIRAIRMKNG